MREGPMSGDLNYVISLFRQTSVGLKRTKTPNNMSNRVKLVQNLLNKDKIHYGHILTKLV